MAQPTVLDAPLPVPDPFPVRHSWDKIAFSAFVAAIWLAVLIGFVPELVARVGKHDLNFPLVVHVHAAVYLSWLVLLTVQTTLIETGRVSLHKRLGLFGAGLAVLVVVMGLAATYVVENQRLATPKADPAFISTLLADLIGFGALAAAGVLLRRNASAHKRLMLLATFALLQAGFVRWRWWGAYALGAFGHGFLGWWMLDSFGIAVLVVALGAHDLVTRRRLHPAWVAGALWILGWQVVAKWLYVSPWWKPISLHLLGH